MEREDTILSRLGQATENEKNEICKALRILETNDIYTISREYRSAAGNSFTNIFRGDHELPYKKILIDVADKLKPGFWGTHYKIDDSVREEVIEEEILWYMIARYKKEWNTLSPSDKKRKEDELKKEFEKDGYSQLAIGSIMSALVSGTAGAVIGPRVALHLSASVFGASSSSILLSSTGIGLLISIPLLIGVLGGPAYRKTILATIYMIRIGRRLEAEALL